MQSSDFYTQVRELLNQIFLSTGRQLDVNLTGYSLLDAIHINIDPAMQALVRTEYRISPHLEVDLRELVNISPPVQNENQEPDSEKRSNLFVTFSAESAQFLGGNATAFGIHFTQMEPHSQELEALDEGIFIPATQVTHAYRLVVFLRTPGGDVSLARTGAIIGLDPTARLVSYQTFQFNPGLTIAYHAPSTLTDADPQVMIYMFLTLTVFLMVNQGETQAHWESDKTLIIG